MVESNVSAAGDPVQQLSNLYVKVQAAIEASEHQQVVQNAKKIIELDPSEKTASIRRCLIASLIKTKAFDEALQLVKSMQSQKGNQPGEFAFEHAYILHRKGLN